MGQQLSIGGKTFVVFLSALEIDAELHLLAESLNNDFEGRNPLFISVLNGAFMFTADLLKKITIPCELSFVKLSSYEGTGSSGEVKQLLGLKESLEGRNIIILEDIVDTGLTMKSILHQINEGKPASVRVATLLFKPSCLKVELDVHHACFSIPNKFVIGYGLDLDGYGRNLPDIYQLST